MTAAPNPQDQALERVRALLRDGRVAEALTETTRLAGRPTARAEAMRLHAETLRRNGRGDEGLTWLRRAARREPRAGEVQRDLAAACQRAGRYEETLAAVQRARAAGVDPPELWLDAGQAAQGLGRPDDAEAAFREALRRRPDFPGAHQALAQLLWMRTGDLAAATSALDAELSRQPGHLGLMIQKARALVPAGDIEGARAILSDVVRVVPPEQMDRLFLAQVELLAGDAEAAEAHAAAAVERDPRNPIPLQALAEARLRLGHGRDAEAPLQRWLQVAPNDQQAWGMLATAWRLSDDPRYRELCDYEALVRVFTLPTPKGWSSLDAYLADLAATLDRLHGFSAHPFDQSLRNGSLTFHHLLTSEEPAVAGFRAAVEAPIHEYMAAIGTGEGPLRARNTGRYRLNGLWSVRLREEGHHVNHVHPGGWIASSFYVVTPPSIGDADHAGWIKFGEPAFSTAPPLPPERWVKPEPGRLVLFPAYLWHGTEPLRGDAPRVTMPFDVMPA